MVNGRWQGRWPRNRRVQINNTVLSNAGVTSAAYDLCAIMCHYGLLQYTSVAKTAWV